MTEEIKEMLWKIKRQNTYDDIGYFKTPLSNDDADKLLNYITNLQDENQNLKKENEEIHDSNVWWSNRWEAQVKIKEDYKSKYEKLQQENEKLKEKINQYENPDDLTLFYMWLDTKAKDKMKQLQQRNEKAIEYIKNRSFDEVSIGPFDNDFNCKENLLNILEGGNE